MLMNNHNLVIYEFDELYKILVEIKKDINLSFEKANKQNLTDLNSKTNYLVFTKKERLHINKSDNVISLIIICFLIYFYSIFDDYFLEKSY